MTHSLDGEEKILGEQMKEISHRFVETNSIQMHIAEKGKGPLVILCHGFPELWYSWRHQLVALGEAGFHAVAPDQRGYGQTDRPDPIEAYNIFQLAGDMVGLVKALGEEKAFIIGHDWGAVVAWHCALLRADIFPAIIALSVPFIPRSGGKTPPTEIMKKMSGEQVFYQVYFQEPGRAEADMEADIRRTMRMTLYSLSGAPPPEKRWRFMLSKSERATDASSMPDVLPPWLTEQEVDYFTGEFQRTGFRGGLNWYRNIDRNWEMTPFLDGAKVGQPALFVAGEVDPVITLYRKAYDTLEKNVINLKRKVLMPGVGHWVNQERSVEVNDLIIKFLKAW
jgi:pimeloyl-ACP methyl ester carboxylesterase